MIVYQTENTPICFSNDSPLSSLSLEYLPNINAPNFNLNSNTNLKSNNIQESDLNSSGDSMLDYNMEGTPICFSYDSPITPLSLSGFSSDGDLSPPSLDIINQRINRAKENKRKNQDQDITSMISNMSIDNRWSTRSSTDQLNNKSECKFGRLNDDANSIDGFSLLDFNREQQPNANVFHQPPPSHEQPAPKFLNQSTTSVVNQNNENNQSTRQSPVHTGQESQLNDKNSVDFEHGFDEYDNEEFYLNKCISFGRLPSKTNSMQSCATTQLNQQQSQQNSISQFNRMNDSQCVPNQTSQQVITKQKSVPFWKSKHLTTFGKKESLKKQ